MLKPKATLLLLAITLLSTAAVSQKPKDKMDLGPVKLAPSPFIVLDSVVTDQWPATLPAVNIPTSMERLNPGQCIRTAAVATGNGHEHYLDGISIAYTVVTPQRTFSYPSQVATATKLIKPEGGDFVAAALAAGGIANPLPSTAAMAASSERWCVPDDATEGPIQIKASVVLSGKTIPLKDVSVQIESIATAAAKTFKDDQDFGQWLMAYHMAPEPGRLLAAIALLSGNSQPNPIALEFLKAAFKQDAPTAKNFGPQIASMQKFPQMLTLSLLKLSGVQLTQPVKLEEKDQQFLATASDLPDPYDMKPTEELFQKLDLLWADFAATGHRKPLAAVASALAWQPDYESLVASQKSGKKPAGLTESIVRAVTYTAAGWSMSSFNRTDPLAADYIQAMAADPKTPASIKQALQTLDENPAFKKK